MHTITVRSQVFPRGACLVAGLLFVLSVRPVAAQGFVSAGVGAAFGGDIPSSKATYNVAAGATAGGLLGFELEFGHTPTFFGTGLDSGSVVTLMGDVLLSVPIGAMRPYAVGGIGLLRRHTELSIGGVFNNITDNDVGVGAGGGVIMKLAPYVGLRAEFRRFHVSKAGGFGFNRVTVGAVLGR